MVHVERELPFFFSFFFLLNTSYVIILQPLSTWKKGSNKQLSTFQYFAILFTCFDLIRKQKLIIKCTHISIELALDSEELWCEFFFFFLIVGTCRKKQPAFSSRDVPGHPELQRCFKEHERILIHTVKVLQWFTICTLWITNTFNTLYFPFFFFFNNCS